MCLQTPKVVEKGEESRSPITIYKLLATGVVKQVAGAIWDISYSTHAAPTAPTTLLYRP